MSDKAATILPTQLALHGATAQEILPTMLQIDRHHAWPVLSQLPLHLTVSIPLSHFTVQHLLGLSVGQVFGSEWAHTEDLPLATGVVKLGWCEFEVIEQVIGVRLTRLA